MLIKFIKLLIIIIKINNKIYSLIIEILKFNERISRLNYINAFNIILDILQFIIKNQIQFFKQIWNFFYVFFFEISNLNRLYFIILGSIYLPFLKKVFNSILNLLKKSLILLIILKILWKSPKTFVFLFFLNDNWK